MSIFTAKISDNPFFSHRPGFLDFAFFTVSKCHIRPFLHKKNHYFSKEFLDKDHFLTLFVLSRASDNTTSLNIGGTNAWAIPHLKLLGGLSTQNLPRSPPLSRAVVPKLCGFLPGEPRTIIIFHNFVFFTFRILFQFADVDILKSVLDIWSHMLICSNIMCCVYDSFWHQTAYAIK